MACETFSSASYQDEIIVLQEDSGIIQSHPPISKMRKISLREVSYLGHKIHL